MKNILIVGFGGFMGSIIRYTLSGYILQYSVSWKFPLPTFIVNVSGCFIAGILAGLAEKHALFNSDLRIFLFTGLVGGYTTFSAFGLETVFLIQKQELKIAAAYIATSLVLGITAIFLGFKIIPGNQG